MSSLGIRTMFYLSILVCCPSQLEWPLLHECWMNEWTSYMAQRRQRAPWAGIVREAFLEAYRPFLQLLQLFGSIHLPAPIKSPFILPGLRGFYCLQLMQVLLLRGQDSHLVHRKRRMRTGEEALKGMVKIREKPQGMTRVLYRLMGWL